MHEMALARDLVDLVREEAAARSAGRVTRVVLEIGVLSHVDPEALRFGFDSAILGTAAEGAALDIETPPGSAWCVDCSDTVTVERRGDPCPRCAGYLLMVTGGEEMRLKEMEIV